MRIDEDVKENMRVRDPDWWMPEDPDYWKFWKEAKEQREKIEKSLNRLILPLIVDVAKADCYLWRPKPLKWC